jgi:hypothetical protein
VYNRCRKCGYKIPGILSHYTLYTPDLNPNELHFFPKLKSTSKGWRYQKYDSTDVCHSERGVAFKFLTSLTNFIVAQMAFEVASVIKLLSTYKYFQENHNGNFTTSCLCILPALVLSPDGLSAHCKTTLMNRKNVVLINLIILRQKRKRQQWRTNCVRRQ